MVYLSYLRGCVFVFLVYCVVPVYLILVVMCRSTLRQEEEQKKHQKERQELRRSAKGLKKDKLPPRFWMGKRVR